MSSVATTKILLQFSSVVSIFGLLTTVTLALNPPAAIENLAWRKMLVGSLFALICILGIVATLLPPKCSETFSLDERQSTLTSPRHDSSPRFALKGHHPNCGRYSAHVTGLHGHVLCAACTGLLVGALLTFAGTCLYFFGDLHFGKNSFQVLLFGVAGVTLGFAQLKFQKATRLVLNIFFVLGAFLILISIDELAQSLAVDLFVLASIVSWIFTRILFSRWDHSRTCHTCGFRCRIQ